ncbi:MAG: class I adenylate-forming enzyme family protein, partial [Acidimicrobiales bacterium]
MRTEDGAMLDLEHLCPLTTGDALKRAVSLAPDVEAVVTPGGRVTYSDLDQEVGAIRSAFVGLGARRGERIGLCMGNDPRWVALFVAITSLGCTAVPINTRLRTPEFHYVLGQARIQTLVSVDRLLRMDFVPTLELLLGKRGPSEEFPALRNVVVTGDDIPLGATGWDEFIALGRRPSPAAASPGDIALIQYTSGTTARPKGVMLTHSSMCANAFISGQRIGFRAGDRLHSPRPFFHVAGTTLSILSCIQHAATLVTMRRFEPGQALRQMEAEACTHLSCNETIALMLLNHPDSKVRRLSLRGGWAAAPPAVVKRLIDELGARDCVVGYGLSEAAPNVAQSCWWEDETTRISGRMRLQPGVQARIVEAGPDGTGQQECAPGVAGHILVRGWNVMQGYFAKPEETARAISADGWLSTGDTGFLDEQGRLSFVARSKDLIRVGGENVAPAEIEEVLQRHPFVRQAAVVGVPDPRLTEVPFAFVVPNEKGSVEPDVLLRWVSDQLANFKAPRHLRIVEDFEDLGMTASA